MKLPRDIGPIHFVGIGGIGMSGVAEVLANLGYHVQGSDVADSANVRRLRDKGIAVTVGHDARNLDGADVVVVSSAVKRDNPELAAARALRLPVVRRAEMLAELMRLKRCIAIAGTHGKTTTTSLVAALIDAGGFDPTVINGGIINAYGTNARLGEGDWMVVEADESDGTFLKLPADIAIVTNVDPEHLDHFKTFDAVQEAFRAFVENVPFYGFAVMCTDHPVVQSLVGRIEDRRIITYGENLQADVRLTDLDHVNGQSRFSVVFRDRAGETAHEIKELRLPMPGRHNALNANAAIAVARDLGIGDDLIRKALAGFAGVKRRFTRTGEWNGIPIIDDYGHHPIEIAAVLRAAPESPGWWGSAGTGIARRSRSMPRATSPAWCGGSPARATSWCFWAPARSRNGPMLCPGSWRRSTRWRDGRAGRQTCGRPPAMTFPAIVADLEGAMPELRGRLMENQSLAELTWFRGGGPAQALFMPEDEADLAYFLAHLSDQIPITVIGLGSHLIVRDGGVPGVVIRLGRGFNAVMVEAGERVRAGAAVPDVRIARAAQEAGIS